jgi:hypothetical protein
MVAMFAHCRCMVALVILIIAPAWPKWVVQSSKHLSTHQKKMEGLMDQLFEVLRLAIDFILCYLSKLFLTWRQFDFLAILQLIIPSGTRIGRYNTSRGFGNCCCSLSSEGKKQQFLAFGKVAGLREGTSTECLDGVDASFYL